MAVIHKISTVIKQVAEKTGYSPDCVASVVAHLFKEIRQELEYPEFAGIRLPYLGAIRSTMFRLNYYLRVHGIKQLRENKITKERFSKLWKLRELTRKDEERRDFKTRYGIQYNPTWRSDTDTA